MFVDLEALFILFQTSSQVTKLENTVETLRTVLTQKIQSEAQTVCSLTHYVGYLESVSITKDFNVSIILESTICFSVFWPSICQGSILSSKANKYCRLLVKSSRRAEDFPTSVVQSQTLR